MGNLVLLAVGLDHYDYLQPLRFAVQDAQGLANHLLQAGFLRPEDLALLTEQSPPTEDGFETHPKAATLGRLLSEWLPHHLGNEDLLWLFFSGYVLNHQGQDYFLLRDSDPQRLPQTAVAAQTVFEHLQALDSQHITLFLDIRRPTAPQLGQAIGSQLVRLAESAGIPALLSCQLDQRSRESRDLRGGLFTTALIGALRYHRDRTLADVKAELRQVLPPLADQCRQPPQTPLLIASTGHQGRSLFVNEIPESTPEATPEATPDPTPEPTPKPTPEPQPASTAAQGSLWQLIGVLGAIASFLMVGVLSSPGDPDIEESTPIAETRPDPPKSSIDPSESQKILEQAQAQIDPGQASSYWRAIEQVRQIEPNQPLYTEAQEAIARWSQAILDLAQQRAENGQIQFAIDAARLIPETSPLHETAQQRIVTWENQRP